MIKPLTVFLVLTIFLSGCSGFSRKQAPAPVYGKDDSLYRSSVKNSESAQNSKGTKVETVQEPVILQQELAITPKKQMQSSSSDVVVALLSEADMSYKQGNLDESVTTLERALRIEPRNALLLYKLALIRLQQGQPELAENLAMKSQLLAEGDRQLKKKSWLLIAQAREQQNNQQGADAALKKAQQY